MLHPGMYYQYQLIPTLIKAKACSEIIGRLPVHHLFSILEPEICEACTALVTETGFGFRIPISV